MFTFEVDPDIRRAKTLATEFYTDPNWFGSSKEEIFAPSWQFVGHRSQFRGLTPISFMPEFLDEPLLISENAGELKCLSNVCTHRGKVLVEQACEANLIRCGYHGRRFSLDGKFLSMPEFDGVENFPCDDDNLTELPLHNWKGFLFTSLGPHIDFHELANDAFARIDASLDALNFTQSRSFEVNAHWALYCENYLEGFHIPFVHQGLNAVVDYGTYTTETFRYSSLQTGYDANGELAARYLFVFPNLMFNFYPWGLSVNVVRPISPTKTTVEFLTYVSDETLVEIGAGANLDKVELEDEAVVESVQRGIRSRFYSHGRYSPTRETGTHHFHRLIAEFMNKP